MSYVDRPTRLPAVVFLVACALSAVLAGCGPAGEQAAAATAGTTTAAPGTPPDVTAPGGPPAGGAVPLTPGSTDRPGRSTEPTRKPPCPRPRGLGPTWASWPMPNPDGAGQANPAGYTDLGDGTVRDRVTCLVWQRSPAPKGYTFSEAKRYCADLGLAGGGWHLPSRIELTSLIDTSRAGPAIDPVAFPATPVAFFWTSSPWALDRSPARAWIINFYEGLSSNGAFQSGAYRVRCVKSPGGSGAASYRIASGQVTDPFTGLVWQQAGSPSTMDATAATAYCTHLGLGGHDWRLPTVKELATTVDETKVAPAINRTAFPGTAKDSWYWSASAAKPQSGKRWALNYDDGYTNFRGITKGYARCVR